MYKVIRKQRGRLYSVTIAKGVLSSEWDTKRDNLKKWRVRYIPNKWMEAEIGDLFVFNNINNAISFVTNTLTTRLITEIEIWRCKTRGTKETHHISITHSPNAFHIFWTSSKYKTITTNPPQGTFTAHKVMLTQRVRTWNEINKRFTKK